LKISTAHKCSSKQLRLPNGDIVFGEKDEKIIVAKCPQVYEYKAFCLGHEK
jgi:uncharacterized protein YuzB (UPF0349 family)